MGTDENRNGLAHSATVEDEANRIKRRERLLDEALKDTFPASDPPSIATGFMKGADENGLELVDNNRAQPQPSSIMMT